ncbi:MAG: hypothetical protein ACK4K3_03895 [Aquabacterium sp.]
MSNHLSPLAPTLDAYARGDLSLNDLARTWRDAARAHQPALPARYLDVLEWVLNQLESAALFTEESCSFSQGDMIGALRDWLTRAQAL